MYKHGKNHYEISNFANEGYESKHNLVYWENNHYYGFGAGAHGYIDGERYSNAGPLKKYMSPLSEGKLPIFEKHSVTKKEMMEEEMFLGLRKISGVSIEHFQQKFSIHPLDVFKQSINEMVDKGLLQVKNDKILLTDRGHYLGNEVFQAFLL